MDKMENAGCSGYVLLYIDKESYCDIDGKIIDKERVMKIINDFLGSFDSFSIVAYEVKSMVVNEVEDDALKNFIYAIVEFSKELPVLSNLKVMGVLSFTPQNSEGGTFIIFICRV